MCLHATTSYAKVADWDRTVWKVVELRGTKLLAPIQEVELTEHSLEKDMFVRSHLITAQGIHAFGSPERAEGLCDALTRSAMGFRQYRVIRGVIPKGTPYWEDDRGEEYAAQKIYLPILHVTFFEAKVKMFGWERFFYVTFEKDQSTIVVPQNF